MRWTQMQAGPIHSMLEQWVSLPQTSSMFWGTNSSLVTFIGVLLTSVERIRWYCLGFFHTMYIFSMIRLDSGTGFIVPCGQDTKKTSPVSSSSPMLCWCCNLPVSLAHTLCISSLSCSWQLTISQFLPMARKSIICQLHLELPSCLLPGSPRGPYQRARAAVVTGGI